MKTNSDSHTGCQCINIAKYNVLRKIPFSPKLSKLSKSESFKSFSITSELKNSIYN